MYPESTSCGEIGKLLQVIMNTILPYKTNGIFVEVGANDGKTGSFTYNLAKIGWHGIYYEPVPRLYRQCCNNHKEHMNVKIHQIGIGEKQMETNIIDAETLSTIDNDTIESYSQVPQFSNYFRNNKKYHTIQVETLDTMLMRDNITTIDILVLDVEGYEEKVLKGFTIENHNPIIFIVEIGDQHPDFINNKLFMERFARLREYFNEKKYKLLVNDVVDNVYVREDVFNNLDKRFVDAIKNYVQFPQYRNNFIFKINI